MDMPQLNSSWKEREAGHANLSHQRRVSVHRLYVCNSLCCCDFFFLVFNFDKSSLLTSARIVQRQDFSPLFGLFYCCTNKFKVTGNIFFLVSIACTQEVRCQLNEISQDFDN